MPADAVLPRLAPSILMVEDDWNLAVLYGRALEGSGCDVTIAETGAAALESASANRPDMIVMDLELPDQHGLEVIRTLRTAPGTADLPMVILSSHHAPDLVKQADELGVLAYLLKLETTPQRFADAVRDLLALGEGSRRPGR
jgi:CheY-like chemotaxis protein